jgi:hypothetical protein
MGRYFGIQAAEERYIWEVAEMGLCAPLPPHWSEVVSSQGGSNGSGGGGGGGEQPDAGGAAGAPSADSMPVVSFM